MELGEPAAELTELASTFQLTAVGRDEHERRQVLGRLALLACVESTQDARLRGVRLGSRELTRAQLDEREIPQRVRGVPLVALAPVSIEALEERPRAVELSRPEEDVTEHEVCVGSERRACCVRREPARLLRELERMRLRRIEADQRESRVGSGADRRIPEPVGQLDRGCRMALGDGEPAGEADEQAEALLDQGPGLERRVLLERRLGQKRNRALRCLPLDLGHQQQGFGARCAGHRPGTELSREHPPAFHLTGSTVSACSGLRAAIEVRLIARRGQAKRMLPELTRDDRCALRGRDGSGLVERCRQLCVRPAGREREVPRTTERILGERREASMCELSLRDRQPLVEHGGQQRVCETNGATCDLDHVLIERSGEGTLLDPCRDELGGSQPRIRGREHEGVTRRAREPVETDRDELFELRRHLHGPRRFMGAVVGVERTRQLAGIERIPTRDAVQPQQCRP